MRSEAGIVGAHQITLLKMGSSAARVTAQCCRRCVAATHTEGWLRIPPTRRENYSQDVVCAGGAGLSEVMTGAS